MSNKNNICPFCGEANESRSHFCLNCGRDLPYTSPREDDTPFYKEIKIEAQPVEIEVTEPVRREKRQISFNVSILGIIGASIGFISLLLSILLFWVYDVTLAFYNPSNLLSYIINSAIIYVAFIIITIVGLVISAISKKDSVLLSVIGFILGTAALAPQIIALFGIEFNNVAELLTGLFPSYIFYTWEPWLVALFIYLIVGFSLFARYFKRILLLYDKRTGKKILQAILWPIVGLLAIATIYLLYKTSMFFVDQFSSYI
ncbi:MAG: hypothetical protein FK734_08545 [Asgard group archaeon]|nr:hypothetical protein [Asgard group archaeon]